MNELTTRAMYYGFFVWNRPDNMIVPNIVCFTPEVCLYVMLETAVPNPFFIAEHEVCACITSIEASHPKEP